MRALARVEARSDRPHGPHSDVVREMLVEALLEAARGDRHREIEVCDLTGGVDAGIGSTRGDKRGCETSSHRRQGPLEFALDRALGWLSLPAAVPRAEIGDGELGPLFHIGYPRTGEELEKGVGVVMAVQLLAVQLVLAAGVLNSGEVAYFPGAYFDDIARDRLQRRAMVRWPGPSELRLMWRGGDLNDHQRMAVLLGGAAHHDALLLDIYREAVLSESQRLRQAGAYGYRDLIGDIRPNVARGVDDEAAQRLAAEIDAVRETLQFNSMVEMWLHAALHDEQRSLPGYHGIVQRRSSDACFRAVERLMGPEDLEALIRAYRSSDHLSNRIQLLKLIEALTLNRFIMMPLGERKAWSAEVYDDGLYLLDQWLADRADTLCDLDYERVISASLASMGAIGVDPLHPEACAVWGMVLSQGDPRWWAIASRRLYECGGPWVELSVLQAPSKENRASRNSLMKWFGLRDIAPRSSRGEAVD